MAGVFLLNPGAIYQVDANGDPVSGSTEQTLLHVSGALDFIRKRLDQTLIVSGSNWIHTVTGSLGISSPVTVLPHSVTISGSVPLIITGSVVISQLPRGQQEMTQSLPVVIASDQSVVGVGGSAQAGSYPDPASWDTGEIVTNYVDAYGNLQTRGPVFTDETSFRDDFGGGNLFTTLTGIATLTSGSTTVVGSGTVFTEEVSVGCYIVPSGSSDLYLTQVDYVVDDTTLELVSPYAGSTTSSLLRHSEWDVDSFGSSTFSIDSSFIHLSSSAQNGAYIHIARSADYLPFVLTVAAHLDNRRNDQEAYIGFVDDSEEPVKQAVFVFSGTDNRLLKCRSAFDEEGIQETEVTLPGTLTTDEENIYQVEITPNLVTFAVNGVRVAGHQTHLPGPYDVLEIFCGWNNYGVVSGSSTLSVDSVFFQNTDQVQVGNIFRGEPQPVQGVSDGYPVIVQFGNPGGGTALPSMINLAFNKSEGALALNVYKRVITYTVPTGYNGYLIRFASFQSETATSRLVAETLLGRQSVSTSTYTQNTSYTDPQWASIVQAEVTTAIQAGAGSVAFTVTYTNEVGIPGRTGTISVPRGSVVGYRADLVLQAGDIGVRSIQNITNTPTVTGAVKIIGLIQLAAHQDQGTTSQTETSFAPGAITFPTGTVLGIEYAGGTVSKSRIFDALVQLVK